MASEYMLDVWKTETVKDFPPVAARRVIGSSTIQLIHVDARSRNTVSVWA